MQPCYYIVESQTSAKLPASIREATAADFEQTAQEHWQTDWRTDFIQDAALEKYALELDATRELVGLAAYRDMPEGVLVYVEYMESAPSGNPTLSKPRKYAGIGAALLAFGIQLSIDYGYGGAIYLKAKTTQLREHYMRNYGAIPFSRFDPFLLLIDGDAARELFGQYLNWTRLPRRTAMSRLRRKRIWPTSSTSAKPVSGIRSILQRLIRTNATS